MNEPISEQTSDQTQTNRIENTKCKHQTQQQKQVQTEPHDSIRKVNSTSKGTMGDNDIAQNNTGHHRRPQGTTGDHRRPGGAHACEEGD